MRKTVVVTGATGFIGQKICLELIRAGHDVRVISRNIEKAKRVLSLPCSFHLWDGASPFPVSALEGADALIHLAGESIADARWSAKVKQKIRDSRDNGTRLLMEGLRSCSKRPGVVIGTSAIGIYGDAGSRVLVETTPAGQGFLPDVCEGWETAYGKDHERLVILRVGIVLGTEGALKKMLPAFRLGGGGVMSDGKQWMSWIHVDDLVKLYLFALNNDKISGVFNAVAPKPVTNADFTKDLSKVLGRPAFLPIPAVVIKLAFGELAQVVLGSQNVSADKILGTGFKFQFNSLQEAFIDILAPNGIKGAYVLEACTWIAQPLDEVFSFFSDARNLETITPPWLNFRIKNVSTPEMEAGTLINYRLKVKGVPLHWRTLISEWKPGSHFVDEQLKGPYQVWHHTHRFEECRGGTLVFDRVVYKIALGPIGEVARMIMVKKDIDTIFAYRSKAIEAKFVS